MHTPIELYTAARSWYNEAPERRTIKLEINRLDTSPSAPPAHSVWCYDYEAMGGFHLYPEKPIELYSTQTLIRHQWAELEARMKETGDE